jgi:hypothetical protein
LNFPARRGVDSGEAVPNTARPGVDPPKAATPASGSSRFEQDDPRSLRIGSGTAHMLFEEGAAMTRIWQDIDNFEALLASFGEARAAIGALRSAGLGDVSVSAATGDLSEQLVARRTGGTRLPKQNRGADVRMPDGRRIEVKSRLTTELNRDDRQFNFRKHCSTTDEGCCLIWEEAAGSIRLVDVLRFDMAILPVSGSKTYYARTDYKKLRSLLEGKAPARRRRSASAIPD